MFCYSITMYKVYEYLTEVFRWYTAKYKFYECLTELSLVCFNLKCMGALLGCSACLLQRIKYMGVKLRCYTGLL
jgi:hypothetical protein